MAINPNNGIAPDDQNAQILKQFSEAKKGLMQKQDVATEQANMAADRTQAVTGLSGGAALKSHENAQRGVNDSFAGANAQLETAKAGALQNLAATKQAQEFTAGQNTQAQQAQAGLQTQSLAQQQGQFTQSLGQQAEQFKAGQGLSREQMAQQQGQFTQAQGQQAEQFLASQGLTRDQMAQALGLSHEQMAQQQGQFTQSQQQQLAVLASQQGFATQERVGTQEFAAGQTQKAQEFQAGQTALDRAQQANQFAQNFSLASAQFNASKDQFYQQMQYQWAEMSENQKTNMINAMTALKNAGLDNPFRMNDMRNWMSQFLPASPTTPVLPPPADYNPPAPPLNGIRPRYIPNNLGNANGQAYE